MTSLVSSTIYQDSLTIRVGLEEDTPMGSGVSGIYYTSKGSRKVHHQALIHSFDGKFTQKQSGDGLSRPVSGGHGQSNIDLLKKNGIDFNIVKTYPNGVRVGNIPNHKDKRKRSGSNQSWFPKSWSQKDMVKAGEHVARLKKNRGVKDGVIIYGNYKGVRVGEIKTNGNVATIFPDSKQNRR